jgi:dihydrofolate synthase/folylpolyglutamate synthase
LLPRFEYDAFSAFFQQKTRWTLRPTRALLKAIKFKQRFRAVHVAGTNGKGSCAVFLDSILRSAGLRTGFYSSPHLARFNERIQVNANQVTDAELAALWKKVKPAVVKLNQKNSEKISEFEAETALAFKRFEKAKVDYAVVETGMGGRLDATNALKPNICVITRISLDHTRELGATIPQIASEKAAIIKRGALAAVALDSGAAALSVVKAKARKERVPLFVVGASRDADVRITRVKATLRGTRFTVSGILGKAKLRTRLLGAHQAENAALAFAAAKILQRRNARITDDAIKKGIALTAWPGRLEIISKKPLVVFDGAHNPGGAKALARALRALWPKRRFVVVFAAMRDKDYAAVLKTLAPHAKTIVATSVARNERSATASEIAGAAKRVCKKVFVEENAAAALSKACGLAGKNGSVLACGSLYLVGELKRQPRQRRKVF